MFDFQVKVRENGSTVAQLWGEGLDLTTVLFGGDLLVVLSSTDGGDSGYMHSLSGRGLMVGLKECGYEVVA